MTVTDRHRFFPPVAALISLSSISTTLYRKSNSLSSRSSQRPSRATLKGGERLCRRLGYWTVGITSTAAWFCSEVEQWQEIDYSKHTSWRCEDALIVVSTSSVTATDANQRETWCSSGHGPRDLQQYLQGIKQKGKRSASGPQVKHASTSRIAQRNLASNSSPLGRYKDGLLFVGSEAVSKKNVKVLPIYCVLVR